MVEVNEEITKAYFEEVCGYLVRTGYHFTKTSPKRNGKNRSQRVHERIHIEGFLRSMGTLHE